MKIGIFMTGGNAINSGLPASSYIYDLQHQDCRPQSRDWVEIEKEYICRMTQTCWGNNVASALEHVLFMDKALYKILIITRRVPIAYNYDLQHLRTVCPWVEIEKEYYKSYIKSWLLLNYGYIANDILIMLIEYKKIMKMVGPSGTVFYPLQFLQTTFTKYFSDTKKVLC